MPDCRTDDIVIFAGPKSKLPDGTGGQAHFGKTGMHSCNADTIVSLRTVQPLFMLLNII